MATKQKVLRVGGAVKFRLGELPDTVKTGVVKGVVRNIGKWWYNITADDGDMHTEVPAHRVQKLGE